jgi:signal transduction histidine kinase
MDQSTVRQMRSQALVLPLITGIATAIGLGTIAGWLTDRVVRRLQTVQRKVQRIAAGDYAPIELTGRRDELHELSSNVNRMAEALQQMEERIHSAERERLVHALAAGLSHDLRNTLTGARLAIQLHGKECHHDKESIAVAMRQLRLAEDQLMRWLRLGGEVSTGADMHSSQLSEILDRVIELVRPMTEHLGSQLNAERLQELESIVFQQSELLTSAVLNLLLNAIQAAGQDGQIRLQTASKTPGWLTIEISDNGPGPSPEVQAQMFDPLVTTKREGVGLGLALVAKAAKEIAGEITWRRESDETVFCLRLPIASPQT